MALRGLKHYICLDLKSIRNTPDSPEGIAYDVLTIPHTADPIEVIRSRTDVPSYVPTMRDGYPIQCIKCGGETSRGGCNIYGLIVGLGRSVCCHCRNAVKDASGDPRGCQTRRTRIHLHQETCTRTGSQLGNCKIQQPKCPRRSHDSV